MEVSRVVDVNGNEDLAGRKIKVSPELARSKVMLRLDGHLIHVIADGVLAKILLSPVPAGDRAGLRGARITGAPLPPPAPDRSASSAMSLAMASSWSPSSGSAYAGKIVTVHVEDTHGAEVEAVLGEITCSVCP